VYPAEKQEKEFTLTPGEMVVRKALLRVDEVAYCLNISDRQVYRWIADGKLRRALGEEPVRVPAADVAHYMQNFEE
jgi:excisionase family DNA binding protein